MILNAIKLQTILTELQCIKKYFNVLCKIKTCSNSTNLKELTELQVKILYNISFLDVIESNLITKFPKDCTDSDFNILYKILDQQYDYINYGFHYTKGE